MTEKAKFLFEQFTPKALIETLGILIGTFQSVSCLFIQRQLVLGERSQCLSSIPGNLEQFYY